MKKLVVTDASKCMACLACASACSEAYYKKFDVTLGTIRIGTKKDGKTIKPFVCLQCGKCAEVCEQDAIKQNEKTGVYTIDKKKCIGCGKCVEVCPTQTMVKAPDTEYTSKCIACGICVKACPMEILAIENK